MGSIPPHESRILPDGCLCPGDLGVGCPYHQAGCQRLPAEQPEQSSLCQVPSTSHTLSAALGNRGKCRLCRCPWPHFPESTAGDPGQGLPGLQGRLPVPGTSFGWPGSDGDGGGLGCENLAGWEARCRIQWGVLERGDRDAKGCLCRFFFLS